MKTRTITTDKGVVVAIQAPEGTLLTLVQPHGAHTLELDPSELLAISQATAGLVKDRNMAKAREARNGAGAGGFTHKSPNGNGPDEPNLTGDAAMVAKEYGKLHGYRGIQGGHITDHKGKKVAMRWAGFARILYEQGILKRNENGMWYVADQAPVAST